MVGDLGAASLMVPSQLLHWSCTSLQCPRLVSLMCSRIGACSRRAGIDWCGLMRCMLAKAALAGFLLVLFVICNRRKTVCVCETEASHFVN